MKKKGNEIVVRNYKVVIMLIMLIVITFGLIIFTSIKLYQNLDNKVDDDIKLVSNNKIYGTVLEVGENYVKVQELDKNKIYVINTKDLLEEGDLIVAYFDEKDHDYQESSKIEVIANNREIVVSGMTPNNSTSVITTTYINSTTSTTIKSGTNMMTSTTRTTNKETKKTTSKSVTDEEVINYFASQYSEVNNYSNDRSFLEKAKEKFIVVVDFIFYDGEIKGKKFNELTASAKAKVIYYTLLIDSKIDSKWPNYKENINNKYIDIKAKLIAKYLDLTTTVCNNNPDTCADFKRDFNLLKTSVGITWDVIKGAFKYAYNAGKEKIIIWYEMFSGKI